MTKLDWERSCMRVAGGIDGKEVGTCRHVVIDLVSCRDVVTAQGECVTMLSDTT